MTHFNLNEFIRSETAKRHNIDNTPTEQIVNNINLLVKNVLEPARMKYGKPIYINSGYRCEQLNKMVGGASRSYHLQGRAADLDTRCGENRILYNILTKLPHKELIWEQSGKWIHVAY